MQTKIPKAMFYITSSEGGYNLRLFSILVGALPDDFHVLQLGLNLPKAKNTAQAIFNAISSLVDSSLVQIELDGKVQSGTRTTGLNSSLSTASNIDLLDGGLMPYGAHKAERISTVSSPYLSSCVEQLTKTPQAAAKKLAAQAIGVLASRGDLTEADICNFFLRNSKAKKEMNQRSQFIGDIKQRIEFSAVIEYEQEEMNNHHGRMQYFYKLRAGDNSIMYSGSSKLKSCKGVVNFRATVKEHHIFKGIRTTVVERPKLL